MIDLGTWELENWAVGAAFRLGRLQAGGGSCINLLRIPVTRMPTRTPSQRWSTPTYRRAHTAHFSVRRTWMTVDWSTRYQQSSS